MILPSESPTNHRALAVVVPMYNEEIGAEKCVHEICKTLKNESLDSLLFVVNDGSQDRTEKILFQLAKKEPYLPFRIISYTTNCGYGAAILKGALAADQEGYEFALFMDSDLTNPPTLISAFHKLAVAGKYDLIKASRYIPGGGMNGVPWNRQLVTILGNKVASYLFGMGIHDCTNGFRAIRLSLLRGIQFQERGFPSILEELFYLKQQNARTTEVPYILTARGNGHGTSKFQYKPIVVYHYLKYAIKAACLNSRYNNISMAQKKTKL